jgi:hypothetical protein
MFLRESAKAHWSARMVPLDCRRLDALTIITMATHVFMSINIEQVGFICQRRRRCHVGCRRSVVTSETMD